MKSIRKKLLWILAYISTGVALILPFISITSWEFWTIDFKLFLSVNLFIPPLLLYKKTRYIRPVIMLMCLTLFGFLQMACPRLPGAIELFVLNLTSGKAFLQFGIKIAIIVIMTLLFSRYYCGWICPKGTVQEMVYQSRFNTTMPLWIDRKLKYLKYIMLGLLILCPLIFQYRLYEHIGPFRVIFNLGGSPLLVLHFAFWIILSVFVERAYCRYFCPEGALLALINKISIFRIRIDSKCTSCRQCEEICPVDAINIKDRKVLSICKEECIVCKECEAKCRKNMINFL
ncbi:MAG TPA: 4Fe-4S binding protein [Candidatus Eremiobacteraeota bacterium]|nr:MAG: putative electron transport protein YccM [bacterium ADurb.Bin363]HPZ10570.1 4Fe-4S binding protein [Candidatus Eremiobacteraeota bacterium]